MTTTVPENAPTLGGVPFTVASRPQVRFSNTQTVSNLNGATSFAIVPLPATGWVRRIKMLFSATVTAASAGALVSGDAPWNLISGVTITDATGQPIQQPIGGYNLYLVNKYFSAGSQATNIPRPYQNPQMSPEYALSGTATTFTAVFRLEVDFEQDARTGYGCIPNLDSNASLQLKVDVNPYTVAFTGTTVSVATVSMRTSTEYWAPVGNSLNNAPVEIAPPGAGDYLETRYETQTVSASSENLVTLTNRGGMIRGLLLVSRAANVRTAITATSNLGILLDNQPINEGVPIEEHYDQVRRTHGYFGADLTTSYVPLTAGVNAGLDRGVVPIDFGSLSLGRNSWLNTRAGSLFQLKVTPGVSATQLEIVTLMMQAKDAAAFYNAG